MWRWGGIFDVAKLRSRLIELENLTADPTFWADQGKARTILDEVTTIRRKLDTITELERKISDAEVLIDLGESEMEVAKEVQAAEARFSQFELESLLGEPHDKSNAIFSIHSGAGGTESCDWAEMLMRMYLRYAEKHKLPTAVLDISYAEGAGIKSATFEIDAPFAFGTLSVEAGTHRLVRMSPFNAAGKRQTSFAAVEVVPLVAMTEAIDIPDADIRVDVFRSSGPGGQSVNTTDSAVRITHLPTGTVVSCQNEKSQIQNKAAAMRVLQSRLLEVRRREEEAKKKQIAGDVKASWGEQMRSYVMAPYQMVKDLRTEYEVNNPSAVFDGDLDGFINAGIRWRKTSELA